MVTTEKWHPPGDPDPHEIMNSTVRDTMAGRHDVALAKFIWFHETALSIDSGLARVRLSFALGYWHKLAVDYPPAMEALHAARDHAC